MKAGYFARLALTGIRSNRRFYLPYFLTCVGMIMMFYIITALPDAPAMEYMKGAETLCALLRVGSVVTALFAALFLFYTHSFLMRRRRKEFGLYSILGMTRLGIARILAWESLILGAGALAAGVIGGALFAKMAELLVIRIMQSQIAYELTFSFPALGVTAVVFGFIFLLIFLWSVLQVRLASAITLLRSENAGEKAPRANWILGLLGAVLLAAAYALAAITENPLQAIMVFFLAVVMVIAATYIIMISGSVLFCKLLQKNRRYYYQPRHFISVSSMAYRMKRNGAGLASICVLSTMVLVTVISSVSLYSGLDRHVNTRYPRDMNIYLRLRTEQAENELDEDMLLAVMNEITASEGVTPSNVLCYRDFYVFGALEGDTFDLVSPPLAGTFDSIQALDSLCAVNIVPLSALNSLFGTEYTLEPGQALIFCHDMTYDHPVFRFSDLAQYQIAGAVQEDWPHFAQMVEIKPASLTLFVPDLAATVAPVARFAAEMRDSSFSYFWIYAFDGAEDLSQPFASRLIETCKARDDILKGFFVESRAANQAVYLATYGGLLFLGILLSIVFLSATVLIIYYKQVTEGFEDQKRFEIMQKVGLTRADIRRSIDSQMLTVFFLPLLLAVMHVAFAIPMLSRMFLIFGFVTLRLILITSGLSLLVFTAFYAIVYRATAHAYYSIVS